MAGWTQDAVRATYNGAAHAVVGTLVPQSYTRRLSSMTISGPAGSSFTLFRGYVVDVSAILLSASRGEFNTYTADVPILIRAGEAATFMWAGGQAGVVATASATLLCEVGE